MMALTAISQQQELKEGEPILLPPLTTLLTTTISYRVINRRLIQATLMGILSHTTHLLKKHSKLHQLILTNLQHIKDLALKNLIVAKVHIVVNQYNQINRLLSVKPYQLQHNKYLNLVIMIPPHIPPPLINPASQ